MFSLLSVVASVISAAAAEDTKRAAQACSLKPPWQREAPKHSPCQPANHLGSPWGPTLFWYDCGECPRIFGSGNAPFSLISRYLNLETSCRRGWRPRERRSLARVIAPQNEYAFGDVAVVCNVFKCVRVRLLLA